MTVEPIHDEFVGVVSGLPVKGAIASTVVEHLQELLDRYSVLVFRGIQMDDEAFVQFGQSFGELEDYGYVLGNSQSSVRLSNLDETKRIRRAEDPIRVSIAADALWHTDNTYRPNRARYSMLLARTVPAAGGGTEFCDTRAAFESLPVATQQKTEGLIGIHSIIYSRSLVGFTGWTEAQRAALFPVPQPLIFINARTGRRSLYLASHICEIRGMPTDEARKLVDSLIDFATQPQHVYTHSWRIGDLVIWDNRATMHRRAPYDDLKEVRELTSLRVIEPSPLFDA